MKRIAPGDRVAIYSPTIALGGKEKCQAFTQFGIVGDGEPYQADMGGGFTPFRRDVDWLKATDAPIAPLLDTLDFTAGQRNWGYQLRFGLFAVSDHDIELIATAMGVRLLGSLRQPRILNRAPHALRCRRHFDMAHPEI